MPIKTVQFSSGLYPYMKNDCVALRMSDKNSAHVEMAFPFHEDTPNFMFTVSEAMDFRDAIDKLIDIKLLEKPKEEM